MSWVRVSLRAIMGVVVVGACLLASNATAVVRSPHRLGAGGRVRSGPVGAGVLLPASASERPRYQPGVVLVGLRPGVPSSVLPALTRAVSARRQRSLGFIGSATRAARNLQGRIGASFVLRVRSGTVLSTVAWLRRQRRFVRYAEPNYQLQPAAATRAPNDPSFPLQWGSLNTGQTVNGVTGTAGADDHAAQAWAHSTGSRSVVIGEVDTGVDYNHPDLAANIWSNPGGVGGCAAGTHGYNVLNSTCDPMDSDVSYNGHGTHVAGIMGAVGNNGVGVAGMNWSTTILPVKWISDNNGANYTSDLIAALNWLLNAKQAGVNVRVVNDSSVFIGTASSQALSDEIDSLGASNILFVTAAGNTGQNNDVPAYARYPCAYDRPTEICVAATNQSDQLPSWSNYGPTTVDLAAPGDNIYSTKRNGSYGYINGTSMSSAQVSGAAGLILSAQDFSAAALKTDIVNNVRPVASLSKLVRSGGILDVCKAMPGCSGSPPPAVPVKTASPVISGTAQVGRTLTASTGQWSNSPTGYAYAWSRCDTGGANCVGVGTNRSSYQLQSTDGGFTLSVAVTASNAAGNSVPASSAPTGVVSQPSAPQGSWAGTYGASGYDLAAWSGGSDVASMPSASVSLVQGSRYVWVASTTDGRALGDASGANRVAATYYDSNQIRLQLSFSAAYSGNLELYAVDWDGTARRESITVAGQAASLSGDFSQGAWVTFPISVAAGGTVTITVNRTAGANAVLSGVFLN